MPLFQIPIDWLRFHPLYFARVSCIHTDDKQTKSHSVTNMVVNAALWSSASSSTCQSSYRLRQLWTCCYGCSENTTVSSCLCSLDAEPVCFSCGGGCSLVWHRTSTNEGITACYQNGIREDDCFTSAWLHLGSSGGSLHFIPHMIDYLTLMPPKRTKSKAKLPRVERVTMEMWQSCTVSCWVKDQLSSHIHSTDVYFMHVGLLCKTQRTY